MALARGGDADAQARLDNPPPLSRHVLHVWNAFIELSQTRPVTGMGVSPISRMDIRLWEADEFVRLKRWERRAILQIDAEYRTAMAGGSKSSSTTTDKTPVEEC